MTNFSKKSNVKWVSWRLCRSLAILYTILLTYLLLTPHPLAIFGATGAETETVVDQTLSGALQHVLAYAVFVIVLWWGTSANWVARTGMAVAHGICCEVLQAFVPHRCCDLPDAIANCVGVLVGGLVVTLVGYIFRQQPRECPPQPM